MPQHQRVFFPKAHFEQPDFMIRSERFCGTPFGGRLCNCDVPAVKDIAHILIDGKLYSAKRTGYLEYLKTTEISGHPGVTMLLSAGNEPAYH